MRDGGWGLGNREWGVGRNHSFWDVGNGDGDEDEDRLMERVNACVIRQFGSGDLVRVLLLGEIIRDDKRESSGRHVARARSQESVAR